MLPDLAFFTMIPGDLNSFSSHAVLGIAVPPLAVTCPFVAVLHTATVTAKWDFIVDIVHQGPCRRKDFSHYFPKEAKEIIKKQ